MTEPAAPIGRYDFRSGVLRGTTLALFPDCLVHRGQNYFDLISLRRVAGLRVAYERDERKMSWGGVLLVIALLVYAVSAPLAGLTGRAAADIAAKMSHEPAGATQAMQGALYTTFVTLQALAQGLRIAGGALALWGLLLLGFGAWGSTTLAVTSGAAQHTFTVRGRDAKLFDFGEMAGDVLRRAAR